MSSFVLARRVCKIATESKPMSRLNIRAKNVTQKQNQKRIDTRFNSKNTHMRRVSVQTLVSLTVKMLFRDW